MDLSAVIFVVLALAWAVFLIPKALKHHDEVARTRSVDKFSSAMRVLARREAVSSRDARLVVTRPAPRAPAPAAAPVGSATASPARLVARRRAVRASARAAARRRRQVLVVLVLAVVVTGGLAAAAVLQPWAVAVPVALTLVYLALCRVLVRREHAAWDRIADLEAASAAGVRPAVRVEATVETVETVVTTETTETVVAATVPAQRTAEEVRDEQGFARVSDVEDTVSIPAGVVAAAGGVVAPDASSLWDPLPVTLPTYVTKPRATRSVRTIDLSDPGVSSSGRDAADSALVADTATAEAAEQADSTGSDHRRAVGS